MTDLAIKPVDIEYLRRLSPLTNVIPLVGQAESISTDQLRSLKASILSELQSANIRPFLFGASPEIALTSSRPLPPYAVSTITSNDDDNMDASLLMSPDYVQPLVTTELAILVEQIFNIDTISWLRHSAAKKCIQWLKKSNSNPPRTQSLSMSQSIQSSHTPNGGSQVLTAPIGTNSYALARITDHTRREERLAQVRLSKWANDLQRSLQNERERYEALARGERAVWLTERLNECVQDGSLVPISEASSMRRTSSAAGIAGGSRQLVRQNGIIGTYSRRATKGIGMPLDRNDPLGLVQLNADIKRKGWAALQILGSFGIIGGMAIWWAKNRNGENESIFWGFDWTRTMMDW